MLTYIVYTDVSGSDVFEIFHVGQDRAVAEAAFKSELYGFLGAGPDDATYLRLVKADLSTTDYQLLIDECANKTNNEAALTLLDSLWYELSHEEIYCETSTDQIVEFYCEQTGLDPYDPDDFNKANDALIGDSSLQDKIIKDYIEQNY